MGIERYYEALREAGISPALLNVKIPELLTHTRITGEVVTLDKHGPWYHGSLHPFEVGDLVLPASVVGTPAWREHETYKEEYVFITPSLLSAVNYALGRKGFKSGNGSVFKVAPLGFIIRDSENPDCQFVTWGAFVIENLAAKNWYEEMLGPQMTAMFRSHGEPIPEGSVRDLIKQLFDKHSAAPIEEGIDPLKEELKSLLENKEFLEKSRVGQSYTGVIDTGLRQINDRIKELQACQAQGGLLQPNL